MNWADHCSSDEESDDGLHPARIASNHPIEADLSNDLSYASDEDSITGDTDLEVAKEKKPFPEPIDMDDLPEDFPTEAPFTAHVNNVAYNIKTEKDFGQKIEGLVKYRYQGSKRVEVTNARFGIDRETGKRRGFAYVEFATPEELMLFLKISDGHSQLHGRDIQVNIARPPSSSTNRRSNNNENGERRGGNRDYGERRGGNHHNDELGGNVPEIDGSKFRGGFRNTGRSNDQKGRGDEHRERLQLKPRSSKPSEDGKPSDHGNWRSGSSNRDSGDRGGRGRGRGRGRQNNRGGGRGGAKKNSRNDEKDTKEASADGWDSAPKTAKSVAAPAVVKEEKKKETKVSNAFAALGFDSDSD